VLRGQHYLNDMCARNGPKKACGGIVYKHVLINTKLQIGKRGQTT